MLQKFMTHGGASTFIQMPAVGPRKEGKYPIDPWDKIKNYIYRD